MAYMLRISNLRKEENPFIMCEWPLSLQDEQINPFDKILLLGENTFSVNTRGPKIIFDKKELRLERMKSLNEIFSERYDSVLFQKIFDIYLENNVSLDDTLKDISRLKRKVKKYLFERFFNNLSREGIEKSVIIFEENEYLDQSEIILLQKQNRMPLRFYGFNL